jgi:hypothetical protein
LASTTTGYPDATTTGVPAGVTLTPYNGNLVINTPGAVISGLDIHGTVTINAPNVTLVNCKVTAASFYVVNIAATGATVQNCTIDGVGTGNDGSIGINGSGTFLNNNIYNVENGFGVGSNSVIRDNYVHNLRASGAPHYDGIQIDGGVSNVVIEHNTIINTYNQTSAVMIDNWAGAISNITVNNNLLVGGGYTIYVDGHFNSNPISGVTITNNHMGSGGFGITNFNGTSPTYTGNVNDGSTLANQLTTTGQPSSGSTSGSAPGAPVISSFSNDTGTAGDGITADNTLELKGTAAANSTVKIYDGSTQIGSATADSSGSWDYITSVLTNAKHVLTATATNSSGQTSTASAALTVTVDTVAPTVPVLSANSVVNTNQVQLSGTAEANSKITVYDGTTVVGTGTTNSSGTWNITTSALSTGSHALTAKATDAAGNVSAASQSISSVISAPTSGSPAPGTSGPVAPVITSFSRDSGTVGDHVTNDKTLTLTGTAAANSTVNVFDGSTKIGTATANSGGTWSFTTSALTDGDHNFTATSGSGTSGISALAATATDGSGTSATSAALVVTIDTSAPDAPKNGHSAVNGSQVSLTGTAEASSTVKVYDGSTLVGTTTTNATGDWALTTSQLSSGAHTLTTTATDAAGNVSAASSALSALIGTQVDSSGSTTLVKGGNTYYLASTSSGTGPVLKMQGKAVVADQMGGWTAIAVEQTATGYQVAWKLAGKDQYSVWNTDSNGNYVSNAIDVASGSSSAVKAIETSFHQDLNGDGVIGLTTTTIESSGSTSLLQAGDGYQLGGSGPVLKMQGAAVVADQMGGWTAIGVEQTATGYQVAWKLAGTNQYSVWNTDSNGNYVSNAIGVASGSSSAVKAIEASFHQDLNGDGTVGLTTTTIESSGSTSLLQAGDGYQLGGSGPILKMQGAAVVADQMGGWTAIGVEQTATGYQVAWKLAGTDQYSVWNTDSNGNYVSNAIGVASGSSSAVKAIENSFHQDLNGDGTIGTSSASDSSVAFTTLSKGSGDIVTIKGVADAYSQIKIYDGGSSLGTVTTGADGSWTFKTSSAVSNTVHTYTAQELDSTGHVVATSGSAILGTSGSNTLKGTTGNDLFVGNGQNDTFVFDANFGRDVIKDFAASGSSHDTIQFSKTVFDSFASVLSHASQVGQDVVISTGHDTLTLKNTKLSALDSHDFQFA